MYVDCIYFDVSWGEFSKCQAPPHRGDLNTALPEDCVPNPRHCGGRGGCEGASAELAFQSDPEWGGATDDECGMDCQ